MRRLLVLVVAVVALAGGCGGDDGGNDGSEAEESPEDSAAPEAPPEPEVMEGEQVEIQAIDNSFVPESASVAPGTEVTWTNAGQNAHNVIPEDEDAEWRVDEDGFQPGDESSFTFDEPGTYRYYCSIHGTLTAGMPGVLVVE